MKSYQLYMKRKDWRVLNKDDGTEDTFDAILLLDNQKFSVKISLRGHHIRKLRKKSFDLTFPKSPFLDQSRMLHLNAEYNDPSLIRNKLSMDFFQNIGVLTPYAEHILLFINGVFKGVYLQLESFDEISLKRRGLPVGPIFYATNDDANFSLLSAEGNPKLTLLDGYRRKFGTKTDDIYLEELLVKINSLPNEDFFREIQHILHVEKYLRWLAGVVCTQNLDGFDHNYALYRNSETKLIEISPWDYDATWGRDVHGEPLANEYVPITGYNTLSARILHFQEFRKKYKDILSYILQFAFREDLLVPKIESMLNIIAPHLKKDPYYSKDYSLEKELHFIRDFIQSRRAFIIESLSSFT